MLTFLQSIAKHIVSSYSDFTRLTIITPSQRVHQYLQEELGKLKSAPFFLPTFCTLDKWVSDLSEEQILSKTALLFELYHIHLKVAKEKESFEQFASWGELLLNDFDELDRYLVDASDLFKNLKEVREIENWSFNSTELTENQKRFISFWENISTYYKAFNKRLNEKGKTYTGAAIRHLSSTILAKMVSKNAEHRYLFVGFNALSPAEMNIIKQLVNRKVAEIFVEGDTYFLEDSIHEAGHFIRRLKENIPETKIISTKILANEPKEVQIVACSEHTGQAKFALGLLSEFSKEELNETVLLLADETLIIPAVKNLPSTIQKANITLGLPLKYSIIHPWVELIFAIQEHFVYFETSAAYHKDIIRLFNSPLFQKVASAKDKTQLQSIQNTIVHKNSIFSTISNWENLSEDLQTLLRSVFTPWGKDYLSAIDLICSSNELIFRYLETHDLLERSALFQFDKAIKELKNILKEDSAPELSLKMFKWIFQKQYTSKSVAYYGNPTDGLQVMGILETRMLDFKNLIILGMNEGNLPPINPIQTIVPMDLRKHFKMPLPADKEALTAHHFYRLLPSAKRVWISYFSGESAMGSECSRYIRQLEMEWIPRNPAVQFQKQVFQLLPNEQSQIQKIVQTDATRTRLKALFAKGLSTSAMNTFLTCPLNFYYRYILGLREDNEVEEDIEASTFGTIVHETLEALYKPFVGKQLTISELKKMESFYLNVLESRFAEKFNHSKEAYLTGKNYISYEIASKQVATFLAFECQNLQENTGKNLFISGLEQKLEGKIEFTHQGEKITICLSGVMDRIDQWGENLRIVDYKTGACDESKVSLSFEDDFSNDYAELKKRLSKSKYVLQLGIYSLLYHQNNSIHPDQCAILSFKNQKSGYQLLNYNKKEGKGMITPDLFLSKIEEMIACIATQMLNTEQYEHDKNAEYCDYC